MLAALATWCHWSVVAVLVRMSGPKWDGLARVKKGRMVPLRASQVRLFTAEAPQQGARAICLSWDVQEGRSQTAVFARVTGSK